MVRDAEAHADEDKKFEELVQLRNQADGMVHAARKTVQEAGEHATDEEKEAIESAAKELEEAIKGDDKDDIQAKLDKLTEASGNLAQKIDRKSTRLNSSHVRISYAVFCLKKKYDYL